nr:MAG TPA: hypothetical protein [Caudoviricetes sp.]
MIRRLSYTKSSSRYCSYITWCNGCIKISTFRCIS